MNPISLNLKCNRNFQPKLYFTNSTLGDRAVEMLQQADLQQAAGVRQVLSSDSESGLGVELAQYLIC
jgi:hypothetical protein